MSEQQKEHKPLDLPSEKDYTHRAHRFPGKFHPPLIKKLFKDHPDREAVADPMCGSGTLAVEGVVHGRDTLCVDIDPLCTLMTRAKSRPVDPDALATFGEEILDRAGEMPEEGDVERDRTEEIVEDTLDGMPFGVPMNLLHWFEPYAAVGYANLLRSSYELIEDEASERMKDAILTALAATVRQVSRADPQPVSGLEVTSVREEELEEGINFDVVQSFNRSLNRLERGYRELPAADELGDVTVVEGDSREFSQICENHGFQPSMIITSPPYCNAIEYYRRHRLEYEWLGLFDDEDVDDPRDERLETSREFIGSMTPKQDTLRNLPEVEHEGVQELTAKIEDEGHERKANLLRKYFLDAFDWLEESYEALPDDGLLYMIVGPSTSYGHTVDTPTYLTEIAENNGFKAVRKSPYKLTNNKMQFPTNGERTETECLVELRLRQIR